MRETGQCGGRVGETGQCGGEGGGDGTVLEVRVGETGQCMGEAGVPKSARGGRWESGGSEGGVPKSVRDGRWHNVEGECGCPNLRGLRDGTVREERLRLSKYRYQTNVDVGI